MMNKECRFDHATHTYTIGGVKVPSVSEVLDPLSNYDGISFQRMEAAREFGNNVHKTIELYLKDELDEEGLDPVLRTVLSHFQEWWFEGPYRDEIAAYGVRAEKECYDLKLRYAGTPDIKIVDFATIDIKTRACIPHRDILQLTAYENFHSKPGSEKLIVLELNQDGCKPVDLSDHKLRKQAWPMFRYLLDRWHSEREFENKIKGWRG